MWCMSSLLLSHSFSVWLWLFYLGLFRHDVMDDCNAPGQRWFAHRNHAALQAKFKHHRISQEKKPKVVNNLFCWCLSMSFCSSISYTILQTHLNTSMFTISPGQPTWRWTERSESSESSENLKERRRGSSKICPKIDGTKGRQIVACSQLWPNPGEIVL